MSVILELEKLLTPLLAEQKYELVDLQYRGEAGGWVLRLLIDHLNDPDRKISLQDCQAVGRLVGECLETSDLIKISYHLEISSPGINRPLKTEAHFARAVGKKVKISLHSALSQTRNQKNFSGILTSCNAGVVQVEDVATGLAQISLSQISKAHLELI